MEIGLTYTSRLVVSTDHVAAVMGSGDLHVFATPAMVALMENAAMLAVAGHLPEGSTTVGAMMNTSHVKPSPVDEKIQYNKHLCIFPITHYRARTLLYLHGPSCIQ